MKEEIHTVEQVPGSATDDLVASKTAKVQNVAYSDAIAKDNLSRTAPSVLKLYAIVAFVTLSMPGQTYILQHANIHRQLRQWFRRNHHVFYQCHGPIPCFLQH